MQLREWREKKKLSQQVLTAKVNEFARGKHGDKAKQINQSTLGYWERGTLPRKWWLALIEEYTKGKVTPGDFVNGA